MPQSINGLLLTEAKRQALQPSDLVLVNGEPFLPDDFDDTLYLKLNPDVAAAGAVPREHYLQFGFRERRRYKE